MDKTPITDQAGTVQAYENVIGFIESYVQSETARLREALEAIAHPTTSGPETWCFHGVVAKVALDKDRILARKRQAWRKECGE